MKKTFFVVAAISCAAIAQAQPYVHQKLGSGFESVDSGALSVNGIPAWSGSLTSSPSIIDVFKIVGTQNVSAAILGNGTRLSIVKAFSSTDAILWEGSGPATNNLFDVFQDSSNLSSLLGADRDSFAFGFSGNNQPIWYGQGANNGNNRDIFMGSTNISQTVLGGTVRDAEPGAVNGSILAWDGFGDNTSNNRDVFKTDLGSMGSTNISSSVLGTSRSGIARHVNNGGDVLWDGSGSATTLYNDVYSNSTRVSTPLGSGAHNSYGVMTSNAGNTLWSGNATSGTITGGYNDVFVNASNLSRQNAPLGLGTAARDTRPVAINESANILWEGAGSSTTNYFDVLLTAAGTTTNLSRTTLGNDAPHEGQALALGENADVIWRGYSTTTTSGKYLLFFYQRSGGTTTNLTNAALSRTVDTDVLSLNDRGQILWNAPSASGNDLEVWLSTPNRATSLTGDVALDYFLGNPTQVQLTIKLIDPLTNAVIQTVNTNLTGGSIYNATGLKPGLWKLEISAPRFLKRKFDTRRLLDVVTLNLSLINGDVNGDNAVNDEDLLLVLFNFGINTSDPVDLNGDGSVNDEDLLIVLFNFGIQGE
ncbi:MAG: hypothetical protein KIT45_08890 [Fimbriimonadia bacterium]|nr:hypothetical protein [Fimbriimonadia bacterium]